MYRISNVAREIQREIEIDTERYRGIERYIERYREIESEEKRANVWKSVNKCK